MLSSLKIPALTALLALGAMAVPGAVSALPAIPAPAAVAGSALPVENAQSVGFYYNRGYHGPRYRVVRPGYRHYYGGYYYRNPYWQPRYHAPRRYYRSGPSVSFGLSFGGTPRYKRRGGNAHVAWCRNRYRTYDVRSDTFIARAGHPRVRCRSPY